MMSVKMFFSLTSYHKDCYRIHGPFPDVTIQICSNDGDSLYKTKLRDQIICSLC